MKYTNSSWNYGNYLINYRQVFKWQQSTKMYERNKSNKLSFVQVFIYVGYSCAVNRCNILNCKIFFINVI